MWAIFQKEVTGFFSSLTGYLVIAVFLIINGLFIWVFPGSMNIPDGGTATLSPLFNIAPWVFLFLIPAITMRSFAEEKKSGTLELLFARPVSNIQIILAKFLAGFMLSILAVVPTLLYYLTIIALGDPVGNIDHGATWGSYIGLLFLAAAYISIGTFASATTDNIIVAFIVGVFVCFFVYSGFDYIGTLFELGKTGNKIISLGIDAHYKSISRGVIDSRDILYFLSVSAIFIVLSNLKLNGKRG